MSQFVGYLGLVFIYMLCVNLPYSLAVRPVYGRATNWVEWITYALIAAGLIVGIIVHIIGYFLYRKVKISRIIVVNDTV